MVLLTTKQEHAQAAMYEWFVCENLTTNIATKNQAMMYGNLFKLLQLIIIIIIIIVCTHHNRCKFTYKHTGNSYPTVLGLGDIKIYHRRLLPEKLL